MVEVVIYVGDRVGYLIYVVVIIGYVFIEKLKLDFNFKLCIK